MIRSFCSVAAACCIFLLAPAAAIAAESDVPEPFRGFDANAKHTINYDDMTALLKAVVVDVGRSTREVAQPTQPKTGTRMRAKVKRQTANEGNRFYFETFKDNEQGKQMLRGVLQSLEQIPSEAPLELFSRDEQLAYWLNLYNIALLNEIVEIYPKRDLKKVLVGKKSILDKKILTVAGIPLSLNDIQFTILKENYDNNPLVMYGLYQGIIGGPDIRKTAYRGATVYRDLESNARDFVNSNRGTYSRDERTFRVSSLYERNEAYFPNFESDLSQHLLNYLEGSERNELQAAGRIKANIDDWTVTDLGGSQQEIGGSLADSRAALMGSVKSTTPADGGGVLGAAVGAGSSSMAAKGRKISRFDQALLEKLQVLNEARMQENERNASVTIEELEDDAEAAPDSTDASSDDK
tara:strand:- start:5075 stop:6301 length:1227 start_codon:yes stop_codon:yes gene_type:complete